MYVSFRGPIDLANLSINTNLCSHSIMRYLATTRAGVAEHWYPKEPHEMAQVDAVLDWHHLNIRKGSSEKAPTLSLVVTVQNFCTAQLFNY
jgi:hypothetical protein